MHSRIKELKKKIFLAAYCGGIAHIPSALSIVEIVSALYFHPILNFDANSPNWEDRDRLILSKGHGSLAIYCALQMSGFFDEKTLYSFGQSEAILGGEPNVFSVPGIEATTGSLGHGLSLGVGMAMAAKSSNKSYKTYVILGDGESQEGSIWEAAMCAAGQQLDNLIVILDDNKIQKSDFTERILSPTNWSEKWASFGWEVNCIDGHDLEQIIKALTAESLSQRPKIVIANTIKGKGVSFMENVPGWHYKMPNHKQLLLLMQELEITQEELDYAKGLYQ